MYNVLFVSQNVDPRKYKNSAATLVNLALTRWNQRFMRADNTSVIVVTLEEDDSDNSLGKCLDVLLLGIIVLLCIIHKIVFLHSVTKFYLVFSVDDGSSECSASSTSTVPISEVESPDSTRQAPAKPTGALVTHKGDSIVNVSSLITPSHPSYRVHGCHGQAHVACEPIIKKTPLTPVYRGVCPLTPKSAPPKLRGGGSPTIDDGNKRERPKTPSNIIRPSDGKDIEFTDSAEDEIRGLKVPSPFSPINTPPGVMLSRRRHTPSPGVKRSRTGPSPNPEKMARQVASNITNSPLTKSCTTRSKARESPKPSGAAVNVDSPTPMDTSLPLDIDVSPLQPSTPELVSPIWPTELGQAALEGSSVIITPSPSKPDLTAALKTIQHPSNSSSKKSAPRVLGKSTTVAASAFTKPSGAQNRIPGFQKRQLRRARYCVKKVKTNKQKLRCRSNVHRTRSQVKSNAAKRS